MENNIDKTGKYIDSSYAKQSVEITGEKIDRMTEKMDRIMEKGGM